MDKDQYLKAPLKHVLCRGSMASLRLSAPLRRAADFPIFSQPSIEAHSSPYLKKSTAYLLKISSRSVPMASQVEEAWMGISSSE
jgi:hypothetical protein